MGGRFKRYRRDTPADAAVTAGLPEYAADHTAARMWGGWFARDRKVPGIEVLRLADAACALWR